MGNKMMEEKGGVNEQTSKKGFEKTQHACSLSVEGVFIN